MLFIVIICLISVSLGAILGRQLAKKGVTAETALEKSQGRIYFILIAIALVGAAFFILGSLKLTTWIPVIILLYIGEHTKHLMLALGSFSLGLLIFLEWPGIRNPRRFQQLMAAIAAILVAWGTLLYYSIPVTGILGAHRLVDGVVIQTTPYTCAAASIATLARSLGKHPNLTEREVVDLAGTSRFGTSILAEIRAMRQLGLAPEYQRNLTVEDLIAINKPAVLHVMEPVGGTRIQHAIALFEVNGKARRPLAEAKPSLVVGNPIYGKKVKRFDEMKDYWLGEGVFVMQ